MLDMCMKFFDIGSDNEGLKWESSSVDRNVLNINVEELNSYLDWIPCNEETPDNDSVKTMEPATVDEFALV